MKFPNIFKLGRRFSKYLYKRFAVSASILLILGSSYVTYSKWDHEYTFSITSFDVYDLPKYEALSLFLEDFVQQGDTVTFVINSPGGSVGVGADFMRALIDTPAKTVAIIPNYAASLGATITIMMDEVRAAPDALIMFHRPFEIKDNKKILIPDIRPLEEITDALNQRIVSLMTPDEKYVYDRGGMVIWTGKEYVNKIVVAKTIAEINEILKGFSSGPIPVANDMDRYRELLRRVSSDIYLNHPADVLIIDLAHKR